LPSNLPHPSPTRLAVRVTPDALRHVRSGHPWVYDQSITSVNRDGAAGDLAVIFDADRNFAAIGLWDPASVIRLKVLHRGKPVTVDGAFFEARIAAAAERRRQLIDSADGPTPTTGYRVVHGENDGLPGMVVDRYGHVVVLKLYSAAWIPHLHQLVPAIRTVVPCASVVLRLARNLQEQDLHGLEEGMSLHGPDVVQPVPFLEHGLRFEADVVHGQKTGHFLDQRENRIDIGKRAGGASVLDVFCCTGGFSVHAAAGGARSVLSVDSSPHAIEQTVRNMSLNGELPAVAACRHDTVIGEAFATLERLNAERARFDIVVVDPPSFARNSLGVDKAIHAYERLTELAAPLVTREGVLLQASCSARVDEADFVRAAHTGALRAGYELDIVRRTQHAIDHPIGFPEGAYLKAITARTVRLPARAR
jgi:23S rRNA (cytosine1962-C5)-methyltransferase